MPKLGRRHRKADLDARERAAGYSRLVDDVVAGLNIPPGWYAEAPRPVRDEYDRAFALHRSEVATSPIIVADNAAEYFFARHPREVWRWQEDFPCVAPPFPNFWLEMARPSSINSEGKRIASDGMPRRFGWHVRARKREDVLALLRDPDQLTIRVANLDHSIRWLTPTVGARCRDLAATIAPDGSVDWADGSLVDLNTNERTLLCMHSERRALVAGIFDHAMPANIAWEMEMYLFSSRTHDPRRGVMGPIGWMEFHVDHSGRIADFPLQHFVGGAITDPSLVVVIGDVMRSLTFGGMWALCLLNCKNTSLRPAPPPPTGLERERRALGRDEPFLRHHVIQVKEMSMGKARGASGAGTGKALHIARGHFAEYAEDRPLFGRPGLHGRFWIADHLRGNPDKGIVVSDYNVRRPG